MSEKGDYVKSRIEKRSHIDQFGTESDLMSYMKTGDANLLQESSVPDSIKGFADQYNRSLQQDGQDGAEKKIKLGNRNFMLP